MKVFSSQKGATEEIQKQLEDGMKRVARLYHESLPLALDVSEMPSAGSAGGLTGGLVAATGARIKQVTAARRRCYAKPISLTKSPRGSRW